MTIIREIDGIKHDIELTSDEVLNAYYEKKFEFDRMDVEDIFCGLTDEELLETYGANRAFIETLIDEMAEQKRRNMDKYDMGWDYARDEAIRDVLSKNMEETA